jgi:hypothetical protein
MAGSGPDKAPRRTRVAKGSSYGWASSLCYIGRFGESRRTVAVAPGASVAVFRSLHTHFIELQPSHTLEQVPSLVLAKQRWNVSEACRLLDDAAHPTHSTNLRSGSVCRSCWGGGWRDGRLRRSRTRRLGGHNKSDAQDR